jgi:hypothetical protein
MVRALFCILTLVIGTFGIAFVSLAATQPSPKRLTLTSDGLGDIKIGMAVDALERRLGKLEIDKAQDPTGHCVIGFLKRKHTIHYMLIDGSVSRIDVEHGDSSNIATERGVRLGSSVAAILKAYSGAIEKREDQGSPKTLLLLHMDGKGEANGIGFYIESGRVTWLMSGKRSALMREEDCLG